MDKQLVQSRKSELTNTQQVGFGDIDDVVEASQQLLQKSFLQEISSAPLTKFEAANKLSIGSDVRLYKLKRLVSEQRELMLENAMNTYLALGAKGYKVFFVIESDGHNADLMIGVAAPKGQFSGQRAGNLLQHCFSGHFPGSSLEVLDSEDAERKLKLDYHCRNDKTKAVTALSGVSSLNLEEKDLFVQGMERFLDAASNRIFSALILAEPIGHSDIERMQFAYENMATELSALNKQQLSYGFQESEAVSDSLAESVSQALGTSLSNTTTQGGGVTDTVTDTTGTSYSVNQKKKQKGVRNKFKNAFKKIKPTITQGSSQSHSVGKSTNKNWSNSESSSNSETNTTGTTTTSGTTNTTGSSIQQTIEIENKSVENLLTVIDEQLERIQTAKAFGGWDVAAYFVSAYTETSEALASMFLGLTRGQASKVEPYAMNTWNQSSAEQRDEVLTWLANLQHPQLQLHNSTLANALPYVTPAVFANGQEMAVQLSLPRRSTAGVTVIDAPTFGRTITRLNEQTSEASGHIHLGQIRHLWQNSSQEVNVDINRLCYHALITGTTGVGKTTTVMSILAQLHQQGIPFMVLEPAKGEYSQLVDLPRSRGKVSHLIAGSHGSKALKINPFVFPQGIALTDHIDRIATVFNAAFSMYGPMPQILEEAIFAAYENLGWDTYSSTCISTHARYPTLLDVLEQIPLVVKALGYSAEVMGDFVGALSARLKSLTRGSLGVTLVCTAEEETSYEQLFTQSNVVDLAAMGSPDKRAIVMGLLFTRLYEYRLVKGLPDDASLRHFMVLEEAHVLLKRTNTDQSQDSSNTTGLAVESFANALAEMRAYGQGFMVADQSASAIDDSVLKNTNLKIIMRAPYEPDRVSLGGALALDEEQTKFLAKLENYTAVIYQSDWLEPVLCKISKQDMGFRPTSALEAVCQKRQLAAKRAVLYSLWKDRLKATEYLDSLLEEASIEQELEQLAACDITKQTVGAFFTSEKSFPADYSLASEVVFRTVLKPIVGAKQVSLRSLSNNINAQIIALGSELEAEQRAVITKDIMRLLRPEDKAAISQLKHL